MSDNRPWTVVTTVPTEIRGQRRELIQIIMRHTIRNEAEFRGPSPREWRFRFADVGGWSTEHKIRQDHISPIAIFNMLHGEAFGDEKVIAALRQYAGGAS